MIYLDAGWQIERPEKVLYPEINFEKNVGQLV